MSLIITVGLAVAVILGVVALVQSRATSLLAWAVTIGFGVLLLARLT